MQPVKSDITQNLLDWSDHFSDTVILTWSLYEDVFNIVPKTGASGFCKYRDTEVQAGLFTFLLNPPSLAKSHN